MANITITQHVLDWVEIYSRQVLPGRMLTEGWAGKFEITALLPATMDALVVTLVGTLAAESVRDLHFSHPATWWDAFKERWFPGWALQRWPAVRIERHWQAQAIAREIKMPPVLKPHLIIYETAGVVRVEGVDY